MIFCLWGKINEQLIDGLGLLLLHPMAGTPNQVRAPVIRTDRGLHFLKRAWNLIRAPIAFTRNEHCGDINGTLGKDLQFPGKGIDKSAAIPIQSALKASLSIGVTVDPEFVVGQPHTAVDRPR